MPHCLTPGCVYWEVAHERAPVTKLEVAPLQAIMPKDWFIQLLLI